MPQARFARTAAPPRPELRSARTEWVRLLRSLVPQPVKPSWFSRFAAALEFRGAAVRVVLPVLAMIVIGVAAVVLAGADSGRSTPPPAVSSTGFPPAALAGGDFAVTDDARGIDQTLGRVASDGDEIVAVGSQTGARIARAQFFISPNGGGSWSMASVRTPAGGPPPPGYAARLVAGGHGAWVALGPGAIWTSPDGRTWTLASTAGLPLRPGDQISVLKRTAAGFIAAGSNVPGGDAAKASPVVFLSANGISWQRLDAAQLGPGRGRRPRHRHQVRGGVRERDPDRGRRGHHGHRQVRAHAGHHDQRRLAERQRRHDLDAGRPARCAGPDQRRGRHPRRVHPGQAGHGGRQAGRGRVPLAGWPGVDA